MLNQDPKMQRYEPKLVANQYYELDTTTLPNKVAVINAANGRADDDMRAVPIAFVDDGQPHDLTNTSIELRVRDSSGVVKVSDKVLNMMEPTSGLVIFGIPQAFYESPGEIQQGYFVLKDKTLTGDSQEISTINVLFTAMQSIDITNKQSTVYISALNRVIDSASNVVTTTGDNKFTGSNSFKTISVDTIDNAVLSNVSQQIPTVSQVASSAAVKADATATSLYKLSNSVNDNDVALSNSIALNIASINQVSGSVSAVAVTASKASNDVVEQAKTVNAVSSAVSSLSDVIDSLNDDGGDSNDDSRDDVSSSVASLSKEVTSMSNTVHQFSYQIAVNSVMTSCVSGAIRSLGYATTTDSNVYGNSALSFMNSLFASAGNAYDQAVRNIN